MRFATLLLMLASLAATDEVVCTFAPNTSYNAYSDQSPSPDASQLARPVNASLAPMCRPNCPTIELFRHPTAATSMVIVTREISKIVYQPEFFTNVYDAHGDVGIQVILAHDLGHAMKPATWFKREWGPELQADAWAGCSMAKLNLNARSKKAALEVLAKYPPVSAPDWNTRLQVIQTGYTQCGGKFGDG
jgi:hypothetical protein